MEGGLDHGIVTMGGGGDFPRNVTVSPLSGVEKGEYFNVLPYAEAAGEYLMTFIKKEVMPRKLKLDFQTGQLMRHMQHSVILVCGKGRWKL